MTEVNPCGWLQNAGATHTAEQMRAYLGAIGSSTPTASTGLIGIGGVHPGLGGALAVTQNGTPNMSVNVASGFAFVPGTEGSKQGVYICENDATKNLAVSAADPTLSRIDIVVARAQDTAYSGATNAWALAVVTGTPSGAPVPPTPPTDSLLICNIVVNPAATSIVNANLTDKRIFSAAMGGITPITSSSFLPANPYDGQFVYQRDVDHTLVWNGSAWNLAEPEISWTNYAPSLTATVTNPTMGAGAFLLGRYRYLANKLLICQFSIQFGSSGVGAGSGFYRVSLPVQAGAESNNELSLATALGSAWLFNNSATQRTGVIRLIDSTHLEIEEAGAAGTVAATVPWTWGNQYHLSGFLIYTTV